MTKADQKTAFMAKLTTREQAFILKLAKKFNAKYSGPAPPPGKQVVPFRLERER